MTSFCPSAAQYYSCVLCRAIIRCSIWLLLCFAFQPDLLQRQTKLIVSYTHSSIKMKRCRWFHNRLACYNEEKPRDRGSHIGRQTSQCDPQPSNVLGPQTGKIWTLKIAWDRYGTPTIRTRLDNCEGGSFHIMRYKLCILRLQHTSDYSNIFSLHEVEFHFLNHKFQKNLCRFYPNLNRGLNCILGSTN